MTGSDPVVPVSVPVDAPALNLPTISEAIIDQWEVSALADHEAGNTWSVNPLAVLAVIDLLRRLRADNERLTGERDRARRGLRESVRDHIFHRRRLRAALALVTEERDAARAEVERLTGELAEARDMLAARRSGWGSPIRRVRKDQR